MNKVIKLHEKGYYRSIPQSNSVKLVRPESDYKKRLTLGSLLMTTFAFFCNTPLSKHVFVSLVPTEVNNNPLNHANDGI